MARTLVVSRISVAALLAAFGCGGEAAVPPPTRTAAAPTTVAPAPPSTVATPPAPAAPTPMPAGPCRFEPAEGIPIVPSRQAPRILASAGSLVVVHRSESDAAHYFGVTAQQWNEDAAVVGLPLAPRMEPIGIAEPIDGEDVAIALLRIGDDAAFVDCNTPSGRSTTCRLVRAGSAAPPVTFGLDDAEHRGVTGVGAAGGPHVAFVVVLTHPGAQLVLFVVHEDGTVSRTALAVELPYTDCREVGSCPIEVRAESDERAVVTLAPVRMTPVDPFEIVVGADGSVVGAPTRSFSAPVRFGWDLAQPRGHVPGHNRVGVWIGGAAPVGIEGFPSSSAVPTAVPWHDGWLVGFDGDVSALRSYFARVALDPPRLVGDLVPAGPRRDASQAGPSVTTFGDHAYVAWEAPREAHHEIRVAELLCETAAAAPAPPPGSTGTQ